MYQIVKSGNGESVGYTEHPRFIRGKNGCFVQTDEAGAQGVAYKGVPYNLNGRDGLGVDDTVIIIERDTAEGMADEILASESRTGEVLCDHDISIEDMKEALCEIDEVINGGVTNE